MQTSFGATREEEPIHGERIVPADNTGRSRLHIGCGRDKWEDATGVDVEPDSAADVLWNLDEVPWPFPDRAFREVIALDVLEHLDNFLGAMNEIHRVLVPGGTVIIRVPSASSHHYFTDPTHRRAFTSKSFQYFTAAYSEKFFRYSTARFEVQLCEYVFAHNAIWLDALLVKFVNRHQSLYERRFLFWYQIPTLRFILVKA